MKTAMQELIEFIQKTPNKIPSYTVMDLLILIEPYLEKEKEQIIDTYENCKENILRMIMEKKKLLSALDYYNQTYNQNK